MRLILIRHGKAERDAASGRDSDRALLSRGERQARHIGTTLAADATPPGLLLSSGFTRAVATARLIQDALRCPLEIEPVLEVGHPASEVMSLLEARRAGSEASACIAVVGHNPVLEEVASVLLHGVTAGHSVTLRTGEAIVLHVPDDAAAALVGACRLIEMRRLDEERD